MVFIPRRFSSMRRPPTTTSTKPRREWRTDTSRPSSLRLLPWLLIRRAGVSSKSPRFGATFSAAFLSLSTIVGSRSMIASPFTQSCTVAESQVIGITASNEAPNHALQRTAVMSVPSSGGGLGPTGSVTGCAARHEAPAQPAPSPCAAVHTAPASGPLSLSLRSLGVATRLPKPHQTKTTERKNNMSFWKKLFGSNESEPSTQLREQSAEMQTDAKHLARLAAYAVFLHSRN